jgi:ATP-dependent Lon protease
MAFMPEITLPMQIDFPNVVRTIALAAKDERQSGMKQVILVAQKSAGYPTRPSDLYDVGCAANLAQVLTMPDKSAQITFQTLCPVRLSNISVQNGIFAAECDQIPQIDDSKDPVVEGLLDRAVELTEEINASSRRFVGDISKLREAVKIGFPMAAVLDAMVHMAGIETADAVRMLGAESFREKLEILLQKMTMKTQVANLENNIAKKVSAEFQKNHRDAILREKMWAIQKELGEVEDDEDVAKSYDGKIEKSAMPDDVKKKALAEAKRMRVMSTHSSEHALIKTYLDELLAMPWGKSDITPIDLDAAKSILDNDHYGIENVKERILEHLAVMKKTGSSKGTIICLVGAPGVGKTSLGQSIARALGRKYQRISLGGVSDEAHFRGFRRTYLGSQPGRIMDALKRAGADNPVIVLDEIDKMGKDYRGDPEHALLEILDPEQNKTFRDHYLEVDFDLSNVVFIATANSLKMSPALLDRMEIIQMPDYSLDEKVEIARRHLLPRAAADTGWDVAGITMDDDAIKHLIANYTNEAGVRNLRRELTAMMRRALYKTKCEADRYDFSKEKVGELLTNTRPELNRRIGFRPTGFRL